MFVYDTDVPAFYMRKRKNKLKYDLIRTFFVPLRRQFRLMY